MEIKPVTPQASQHERTPKCLNSFLFDISANRIAGLEPIVDVVVEFDHVKNPLGDWCAQQQEFFGNLSPLEVTSEQLLEQQKAFQEIVADIQARSEQVEKTEQVALKFAREFEVCCTCMCM